MARKRANELVNCRHFQWVLTLRNGVYHADGRRNRPSTGRHSLNTRLREVAISNLAVLDEQIAVERGLAEASVRDNIVRREIALSTGVKLYLAYVGRPRVAGGAGSGTVKRYRPVFRKALAYFESRGLTIWNQVTRQHFNGYLGWLDEEGYAYATEFLEGNTI
jgi:hypothetical protein